MDVHWKIVQIPEYLFVLYCIYKISIEILLRRLLAGYDSKMPKAIGMEVAW